MSVLERAKAVQAKIANETNVFIRLDLLEGLILEIETLQHRVDALSQAAMMTPTGVGTTPLKPVADLARARAKKNQSEGDEPEGQAT